MTTLLLPGWAWIWEPGGRGEGGEGWEPRYQVPSLSETPSSYSLHSTWPLLLEASIEAPEGQHDCGGPSEFLSFPDRDHSRICIYNKFPQGILTYVSLDRPSDVDLSNIF